MSNSRLSTKTHCGTPLPLHLDAGRALSVAARKHGPRIVFGPAAFAVVAAGMTVPANASEATSQAEVAPTSVSANVEQEAPVKDEAPAEQEAPKQETPKQEAPVKDEAPAEQEAPKQETPKETAPVKDAPKEKDTPKEKAPVKEAPKEKAPVKDAPKEKDAPKGKAPVKEEASKDEAKAKETVKKAVAPTATPAPAATQESDGEYAERGSDRGDVSIRESIPETAPVVDAAEAPVFNETGVLVSSYDKDTSYDVEFLYNEETIVPELASAIAEPAAEEAVTAAPAGGMAVTVAAPEGEVESPAKKINDVLPDRFEVTETTVAGVETTVSTADRSQAVIDIARQSLGVDYSWGDANLATGVDCSGLTSAVYAQLGVDLPRTSAQQKNAGVSVPLSEAKPGDLIWSPGHIAIYAGNGNIIEASGSKGKVIERAMWQVSGEYKVVRVLAENNA